MKKLILLSTFFFSISIQALPSCGLDTTVRWDNCFGLGFFEGGEWYNGEWKDDNFHGQGTYTFADGAKYVGEWKDGKYHGQGTYTFASGIKAVGYFMNGEYIPDICEGMGLVKGTDSFGNCVLKLIDNL